MFTHSVNIKLTTAGKGMAHLRHTLASIENTWKKIYPNETFNYRFFDNTIASFYEKEERLSKLMYFAMVLTISISCIGLFGLSALTMRQRTKEIGIRKVLGAGFGHIVVLLGKDTVTLILIAVGIASPIAWYGMHKWLNGFAFRIDISAWIFLLAGAFAVGIALCTISYHAIRAALINAVDSIRTE
jgi:ABC-type antimicrobial peptide transport system permease subunit